MRQHKLDKVRVFTYFNSLPDEQVMALAALDNKRDQGARTTQWWELVRGIRARLYSLLNLDPTAILTAPLPAEENVELVVKAWKKKVYAIYSCMEVSQSTVSG